MKTILSRIFGIRKIFYIPILVALTFGYILAVIDPNVEVKHVYKVLPAFIVYVDDIKHEDMGGYALAMTLIIEKQYRNDKIVLDHELVHVKQGYRTLFTNNLLIPLDNTVLVKMECEAYATQINSLIEAEYLSIFLKENYETSLSQRQIKGYLIYYWQTQKT